MSKHILHIFSTFAVGGSQIRFTQILNALDDDNQHTLISLDGNLDAQDKLTEPNRVHICHIHSLKSSPLAKRLLHIRQHIKRHKPDVMMTYNWGAIEWVLTNRLFHLTQSVHWEDGFGPDEKHRLLPRRNLIRKVALSGSRARLVVPSHNLMTIAKQFWSVRDKRLIYFPNGITCPTHPVSSHNAEKITCITLATLRAEKNIPRLINAFCAAIPQGELLIGGDGPLLCELRQYVKDKALTDRVKLVGHIHDVWGFLTQGTIFCLSSDTEQMPISLLEAMSLGLPVISTDVGDVKAMVAPENQPYVVSPDNFTQALTALASRPESWPLLGQANREKTLAEYSFQTMLDNFNRLVNSP